MLVLWQESSDKPRQHIKKQRHYFANKGLYNQGYGFSNSHVWMWELDYKEGLMLKNWCFWNCGVGVDSWESLGLQGDPTSPPERKSILNIHWKDWCWSWNSNTWPPDGKNWFIRKHSDAGKDWRQEEKGTTEDEMVGWYHQLDGHEFVQALGDGEGQGSLVCCSSWSHKKLDIIEWLSNNNNQGVMEFWNGKYETDSGF